MGRRRYFSPPSPIALNAIFVRRDDASGRERMIKGIQCGLGPEDTFVSVSGDHGKIETLKYEVFVRAFEFRRHRFRRTA